ncbi:hypothetical protein [Sphingomonas sp.]|uniref:hypothetical protein n=1 Tax=Sphingomonas sp. TaxID=28214 RepID=UPI002DD693F5|nr:hypothetical protein [Sphingomonas sp.]
MILALLLALQAAPAPAPADEVTVIGQRLEKDWSGRVRFTKSGTKCDIRKSTGDAEIDRIGCTAMERCFPQYQARYQAANDRAVRPDVKKVMQAALNQELTACVTSERKAGIAALAAKRRGG